MQATNATDGLASVESSFALESAFSYDWALVSRQNMRQYNSFLGFQQLAYLVPKHRLTSAPSVRVVTGVVADQGRWVDGVRASGSGKAAHGPVADALMHQQLESQASSGAGRPFGNDEHNATSEDGTAGRKRGAPPPHCALQLNQCKRLRTQWRVGVSVQGKAVEPVAPAWCAETTGAAYNAAQGETCALTRHQRALQSDFAAGDAVYARYFTGEWYKARIVSLGSGGKFEIAWEDGDTADTMKILEQIRRCDDESSCPSPSYSERQRDREKESSPEPQCEASSTPRQVSRDRSSCSSGARGRAPAAHLHGSSSSQHATDRSPSSPEQQHVEGRLCSDGALGAGDLDWRKIYRFYFSQSLLSLCGHGRCLRRMAQQALTLGCAYAPAGAGYGAQAISPPHASDDGARILWQCQSLSKIRHGACRRV